MKHGRRDRNERSLVAVAKQLGAAWLLQGPLDGWILWRGVWLPVEVKDPRREGRADEFTPAQQQFFEFCRANGGRWLVWRTHQDVIRNLQRRVAVWQCAAINNGKQWHLS